MKSLIRQTVFCTVAFVGLLSTGCKVSLSGNTFQGDSPNTNDKTSSDPRYWPAYATSPLSGIIFGAPWTAVMAVARPSPSNPYELALEFYAEDVPDACSVVPRTTKPVASLWIPKAYTQTEYLTDLSSGTVGRPVTLSATVPTPKSVVAQRTKLRIDRLNSDGFDASLYVQASENGKVTSEINGQIPVVDCSLSAD